MLSNKDQILSFSELQKILENQIFKALELKVFTQFASSPVDVSTLLIMDKSNLEKFSNSRKNSFLVGRKALYDSLSRASFNLSSVEINFPNQFYSLSHKKNLALAIAHKDSSVKGIGIDLEFNKSINLKTHKFFLKNETIDIDPLMAWTIKEACFKAQPGNAGLVLNDFVITKFHDNKGSCLCKKTNASFEFICTKYKNCLISVALTY